MKQGPLEVHLVNPNGNVRYKERVVIEYFVAVPGQDYHVKVSLDDTLDTLPTNANLAIRLHIDGHCTEEGAYFDSEDQKEHKLKKTFKGFRVESKGMYKFLAFRFATALPDAQVKNDSKVGTIEVKVEWYTVTRKVITEIKRKVMRVKREPPSLADVPDAARIVQYDNKKLWKQPSASTERGAELGKWKRCNNCSDDYEIGPRIPICSATMLYHTGMTLNLLALAAEEHAAKQQSVLGALKVDGETPISAAKLGTRIKRPGELEEVRDTEEVQEVKKVKHIDVIDVTD